MHFVETCIVVSSREVNNLFLLQSTRFTHERSSSNIHRLVHSLISFFEKFSNSANLGFYIQNINFVVGNFLRNIVIIIRTSQPFTLAHDIFIIFKCVTKKLRGQKADQNKSVERKSTTRSNPSKENPKDLLI